MNVSSPIQPPIPVLCGKEPEACPGSLYSQTTDHPRATLCCIRLAGIGYSTGKKKKPFTMMLKKRTSGDIFKCGFHFGRTRAKGSEHPTHLIRNDIPRGSHSILRPLAAHESVGVDTVRTGFGDFAVTMMLRN